MEDAPIFIKIEQHKELADILKVVNEKLTESTKMLEQLEKLKVEEDTQLKAWAASLEDVKMRTSDLNKALFTKA